MTKIIFIIIFNIVLIMIQVFITSKDRGRAGLIIPILNTIGAFLFALFVSPYSTSVVRNIGGVEVTTRAVNIGAFLWSFIPLLMIFLIPAAINFLLYFNSKRKAEIRNVNDLDKMKIDDM